MPEIDHLAINLASFGPGRELRDMVESCARLGIRGIAPWRDQVVRAGLKDAGRMMRQNGMRVTGLYGAGGLTASDGQERRRRLEENRRALEEAATLEAACLVLEVGGLPPRSRDLEGARHMVEDGLASILDDALSMGVPLAIEPGAPASCAERSVVTTLGQALDICTSMGTDGLGVALDIYASWWDPGLSAAIERAGKRLLTYQIADHLVPTGHAFEDRGLMGDGVIDLPNWRRRLEAIDYRGLHEVEITSRAWWGREPVPFLRACVERFESAC